MGLNSWFKYKSSHYLDFFFIAEQHELIFKKKLFHLLESLDLRLVLFDGLLPHHDLLLVLFQLVLLVVQLDAQSGLLGLELQTAGAGKASGQARVGGPDGCARLDWFSSTHRFLAISFCLFTFSSSNSRMFLTPISLQNSTNTSSSTWPTTMRVNAATSDSAAYFF